MTVFNASRLNRGLATSVAKFLKVSKVEIRYSDWMNEFGVWIKNPLERTGVPKNKRELVNRYVYTKLARTSVDELARCPKVIIKKGGN